MAWRRRDEGAVPEKRTRDKKPSRGQRRQWKPTKETLDLEALIAADGRAPLFEESVDLWRDDLDPHSFGFFRVRVRANERFWVAYSRFFIRVNGVRARVIDARFAGFGDRVLRERSWREGDWTAVAGAGAPPCVDLGGAGDRHCARALPLVKRETDELRLPATLLRRVSVPRAAVAWSRGGATLVAATAHVAVLVDDASIAAVDPTTGADRWTRCCKAAATAVAASDEYVAVGYDDGRVEVLNAAGGALAATVELGDGLLDRGVRGVAFAKSDVVAATTPRCVVLFAAGTGAVVKRLALDRPATALAAADGVAVVGAAAGSDALVVIDAATAKLASPAAVCALAVRKGRYAAGCLDGAVRIYGGGGVTTWAGFQAPVRAVAFSGSGWLLAAGGRALACVAPGLARGEAPVLCVAPRRPRWAHAAWRPGPCPILAAAAVDGRGFVFDVARADDAVPRAAAPVRCLDLDAAAAVAFSCGRLVVAGRGGAVGVADDDCEF
jgi:hypothetical protein